MANHGAKALAIAVSLLLGQASVGATQQAKFLAPVVGTAAIIGGDTNAIIGGDRQKARQPSAIIGGDTNAIIGGDRQKARQPSAIIGGDTNAIIGGDTNAIIGGDRQKARQPSAIIGGDTDVISSGSHRLRVIARGPVDYVDATTGRVQVMGQEVATVGRVSLLQDLSVRIGSGEVVTATVYGSLRANGKPNPKSLRFSREPQIPGVTTVTVLGLVQRVDRAHATLVVGGVTVDYTPLLASGPVDFSPGTVVEVSGVRFSANAPLLASSVLAL